MKFTLKNLKHIKSRSQETHCFETTLCVDGKILCIVENGGHGGCDNYHQHKSSPSDWREQLNAIDAELGKELVFVFKIPNSLEIVVSDLINDSLCEKELKSLMKRRVVYTVNGKILQLPTKYKPSKELYSTLKKSDWWTSAHKVLEELPLTEALAIFRKT